MHALLVLDQPKDEVALLEGATANSAAVIAAEALLVDGSARASQVACLVSQVDSVLAGDLIFFLDVVDDSRRVVLEVSWHYCFGVVDHEEGGESSRPVD